MTSYFSADAKNLLLLSPRTSLCCLLRSENYRAYATLNINEDVDK